MTTVLVPGLSQTKSLLEKAVYRVTHYAFDNADLRLKHSVNGYFTGPLDDLRYFHPNAANRKTFDKLVAKVIKIERELASPSLPFIGMVNEARMFYTEVERLTAAEKARPVAKRTAIAEKAAKKKDLGTDLTKHEHATMATYKTLLTALEPVRVSVEQHYVEILTEKCATYIRVVADNGGLEKSFFGSEYPFDTKRQELPKDFKFFFECGGWEHPTYVYSSFKKHSDLTRRIAARALEMSIAEVTSFSGKLAGKIDREANGSQLVSATVSGYTLWNRSTLKATLGDGSIQIWNTQIIWNRSCLGASFNQWPTRRG